MKFKDKAKTDMKMENDIKKKLLKGRKLKTQKKKTQKQMEECIKKGEKVNE